MSLQREVIPFTTEQAWKAERVKDLTSSDVPCLFNQGYLSYEQLFQYKLHGKECHVEENERMQWGVALQDSIADEFAKRNHWRIRKKSEYIRIPSLHLGSSFDFEIEGESEENGEAYTTRELLEIKNVSYESFKNNWKKGFEIEATPYIEIQVQHQLLVSELKIAYIGVLIGGNEGKILKREANPKIQNAILCKAREFWGRIDQARSEL